MVSLEDGIKRAVGYYRRDAQLMVPNGQLNTILDTICEMRSRE
jgi:hypothetical protein